jgi:hypothetical protein
MEVMRNFVVVYVRVSCKIIDELWELLLQNGLSKMNLVVRKRGKGKVHPRTGHEGPEWE